MPFCPQFFVLFQFVHMLSLPVPFFPCLSLFCPCSLGVLEQPHTIQNSHGYTKSVYDTIKKQTKTSVQFSQSVSVSTFLANWGDLDRVFPLWEFVLIDATRYWAKTLHKYFQAQRAEYLKFPQKGELCQQNKVFLNFLSFNISSKVLKSEIDTSPIIQIDSSQSFIFHSSQHSTGNIQSTNHSQ